MIILWFCLLVLSLTFLGSFETQGQVGLVCWLGGQVLVFVAVQQRLAGVALFRRRSLWISLGIGVPSLFTFL